MRFARSAATAHRVIDGRAVVVSLDANRLVTLNPQGSHIWSLLDSPTSLEDIVASLCARFEVEPREARRDAESFLAELVAKGLVVEGP